jgi:hypothetical protein
MMVAIPFESLQSAGLADQHRYQTGGNSDGADGDQEGAFIETPDWKRADPMRGRGV